jgi:Hint domain
VQALRVGDLVSASGGRSAPVMWLRHRRVDCRRHLRPHDVWPVHVQAHAFGNGLTGQYWRNVAHGDDSKRAMRYCA